VRKWTRLDTGVMVVEQSCFVLLSAVYILGKNYLVGTFCSFTAMPLILFCIVFCAAIEAKIKLIYYIPWLCVCSRT